MNNNTNFPLVSIIVAAYNVEKWLSDCLNSVLNQTYHNWECIIVNDGSKDKTKDIALEFCAADSRFRLIDKANEGVSTVRNVGLDNANGDFIQFIDGDDMLTDDCLDYCVDNIRDSHILASDCVAVTKTNKFIRQTKQDVDQEIDCSLALKWILDRKLLSSVWSKFYRKDVIGDLRFNVALRGGQDIYFNIELFLIKPDIKVKVSTHPIYKYRIVNDSISHIKDKARLRRQLAIITEMDCLYENHKAIIDEKYLDEYSKNMIRELLFNYSLQGVIKQTDKSLIPFMTKWHSLLVDKSSKEFLQTRFVEKKIDTKTDMFITLKYLPKEMKYYLKRLLRKFR